jgi:hypothetical protein
MVAVLAKLLQTKHNEVFFHCAHPFPKLEMKNEMSGSHKMLKGKIKKKQTNLMHKQNIIKVSFSVVAFGNTQEPSYLCLFLL